MKESRIPLGVPIWIKKGKIFRDTGSDLSTKGDPQAQGSPWIIPREFWAPKESFGNTQRSNYLPGV